ncbi:O-antigen polysaccharide polymerase Wzy [Sulfitobacter sp. M39]|uniref:O-antigen polymerase n=1 Tax=Sulfitobacter sp. M39 TaxID=2675334 RepID=UPI001F1F956B|nr:O-antigen polysaccharide polymerase Wzy [Sulfitobacter sp. M39]
MFGIVFIAFGILFVAMLFFVAYATNGREVFSPPMIFCIFVFVYVFLRTIYMFYVVDFSEYEAPVDETILGYGFIAMTFAIVSYCAGYLYVGKGYIKLYRPEFSIKGNLAYYVLIAVALLGLLFYFRYMGVLDNPLRPFVSRYFITDGNQRSSLTFLAMGADVLYVIFLFRLAQVKKLSRLKPYEYMLILIPIFTNIVTTNRGTIILYIFGVLCVTYSLRNFKFPYLKFLAFVITIVGTLGVVRGVTQSEEQVQAVDIEYVAVLSQTIEHIMERPYHIAIDKTSFIISEVSERNLYLHGESLISFIFAPIPRIFWADKPSVTIGPWVAKVVYSRENRSGVPPGLIAELFLNFSWPGIIIGMFFYGVICRVLYNTHKRFTDTSLAWRVFYSIFLISFIFRILGADFSGAAIFFLRLFVPFFLILTLTKSHKPTAHSE